MSEVLCNVYVLFNCLYVCFCFSLYLYCICCIEEALMLAIDQPLHPHRKYRPPCCDFTAPNLHQMDPTVGQINRRLDLKDLQGKFVPKYFLVRNFGASGQMSWAFVIFFVKPGQVFYVTDLSSKSDFQAIAQLQILR